LNPATNNDIFSIIIGLSEHGLVVLLESLECVNINKSNLYISINSRQQTGFV